MTGWSNGVPRDFQLSIGLEPSTHKASLFGLQMLENHPCEAKWAMPMTALLL